MAMLHTMRGSLECQCRIKALVCRTDNTYRSLIAVLTIKEYHATMVYRLRLSPCDVTCHLIATDNRQHSLLILLGNCEKRLLLGEGMIEDIHSIDHFLCRQTLFQRIIKVEELSLVC